MLNLLVLLAAAAARPAPATPSAVPDQPALTRQIDARDSEFFRLFFEDCDPARVRTMMADDIEMYHDKGGFVWSGAEAAVADYAKSCEERKKPDAWRSRRALVRDSLRVDPVPGHGAIEDGVHLFYERRATVPSASPAAPASPNCGPWAPTAAGGWRGSSASPTRRWNEREGALAAPSRPLYAGRAASGRRRAGGDDLWRGIPWRRRNRERRGFVD